MPDYIQHNEQGRIINKWYSVDPSIVKNLPNIIEVARDFYNMLNKFYVVDAGVIRSMTQTERDILIAEEITSQSKSEDERIKALDDKMNGIDGITLVKIDAAIDKIGSLSDAKNFLKKLCRYIIKFIAR